MRNSLYIALRVFALAFIVLGLGYPMLITVAARLVAPVHAEGSLVLRASGAPVGSALIGQEFKQARYFHPRPSAHDYDPLASGGSNLGPTSRRLAAEVSGRSAAFGPSRPAPVDALTSSASGLDPDISPANALAQARRVADARGVGRGAVIALVRRHTVGRDLGFIGEPRVNVLELNSALDDAFPTAGGGDAGGR